MLDAERVGKVPTAGVAPPKENVKVRVEKG
jgi:hypothetical protein